MPWDIEEWRQSKAKEPVPKSEVTKLQFYAKPYMAGDYYYSKLVDHYFDQREKILAYKGASAVDRHAVAFYESLFIFPTRAFWWHNVDKKYLNTILWLLRRLKVGITPEQEMQLFLQFRDRLSWYRGRIMAYKKEIAQKLSKRWGLD